MPDASQIAASKSVHFGQQASSNQKDLNAKQGKPSVNRIWDRNINLIGNVEQKHAIPSTSSTVFSQPINLLSSVIESPVSNPGNDLFTNVTNFVRTESQNISECLSGCLSEDIKMLNL